jgi:hypothetical protein
MAFGFGFGFGFNGGGGGGGGPTLDLDFLLGTLPSTVTFTRSSTATYFDSTGALATAAIDVPRFDYNPATLVLRGLLIEEQRVNSIRNNTAVGAVAGTPGTLPTNWSSTLAGLTQTVVGTGIEDGINYIDIRLNGTTTATSAGIRFETTTGIAVASGQTWTVSTFGRLVGGSATNITNFAVGISGLTAGGVATTDTGSSSMTAVINSASIAITRTARALTYADATTAFARVQFIVSFAVGVAIDATLRIGLPQMELGAFATSVIPTTGATATRAPDVATMVGANFSNWYNQSEGTLNVQYVMEGVKSVAAQRIAQIDDGTETNRIVLFLTSTNTTQSTTAIASGNTGSASVNITVVAGALSKQASAYKLNDFNMGYNGTVGTTDTSVDIPAALTTLRFATSTTLGSVSSNMWFQRITYYPRRLSNAELQVITT